MGGKGAFIWSAYAICLVVLLIVIIAPIRQHKQIMMKLKKQSQVDELNSHEHSS